MADVFRRRHGLEELSRRLACSHAWRALVCDDRGFLTAAIDDHRPVRRSAVVMCHLLVDVTSLASKSFAATRPALPCASVPSVVTTAAQAAAVVVLESSRSSKESSSESGEAEEEAEAPESRVFVSASANPIREHASRPERRTRRNQKNALFL